MFGLSFWEIAIIMAVALIVFGPSKLPELAKSLGKGLREFRKATEDFKTTIDSETHRSDTPPPKQVQGEQKAALPADGSSPDATDAELVESSRPEEAADKAAGAAAAAAAVANQTSAGQASAGQTSTGPASADGATELPAEPVEANAAPEGTIARGADPDASEKKAES